MKFLRQKETKRKISFLMALAMMVSLLPVSPIAKAAALEKATVNIEGVQNKANIAVLPLSNTASQAAITLKTETNKKFITNIDGQIEVAVTPASDVAIDVTRTSDSECKITFPVDLKSFEEVTNVTVSAKNGAKLTEDVKSSSSSNVATNSAISDGSDNQLKEQIPVANAATAGNEKVQKQLLYEIAHSTGWTVLKNNLPNLDSEIKNLINGKETYLRAVPVPRLYDTKTEKELEDIAKDVLNKKENYSVKGASTTFTAKKLSDILTKEEDKENGVFGLEIDLYSGIASGSTVLVRTNNKITELDDDVIINIQEPIKLANKTKAGHYKEYYVLRIHGTDMQILKCDYRDGIISFASDKFSTYVLFYEWKSTSSGVVLPDGNIGSGSSGSSSSSPAPSASATAAPSATPSASAAPGTSAVPTNAPSTSAAPTNAPSTSAEPTAVPTNAPSTTTTVKVGNKVTASNLTYKVTSVSGTRTVQFTGVKNSAKIVKIPATIKISGKSYKVTTIAKGALKGNKKVTKVIIGKNINKIGQNAFKGCKNLKTVRINTTKLTASKVKANAFKGIKKNATFKVPSGKIKKYKKIVQAKGAGKKIKVIKK